MSLSFAVRVGGLALLAGFCGSAPQAATPPASAGAGDPLDAAAPVPALPDPAPFAGYLPFRQQAVAPWRESNAAVAPARHDDAHAGHHGHHAAPPAPEVRSDRDPAPAPAPGPRHGHQHHHHH